MRTDPELKSIIAKGIGIKEEDVMNPSAKIDGKV